MKYGFGVDLGGTTVKIAYFAETGAMLDKWEIPTVTQDGGDRILPDIAASIRKYREDNSIADESLLGIGIGVPGPVNGRGVVNSIKELAISASLIESSVTICPKTFVIEILKPSGAS